MTIINSVIKGGGTQPSGTVTITNNGQYDVTAYANADVNVPTTAPAHYVENTAVNNMLYKKNGVDGIDLTGVVELAGEYCLAYSFYTKFNPITYITGTGLKNANALKTISGESALDNAFTNQKITATGLDYVETISGTNALSSSFYSCRNLTDIGLSNVKTLSGRTCIAGCFYSCEKLEEARFTKLDTMSGFRPFGNTAFQACFGGCVKLKDIYFNAFKASTFASAQDQIANLCNTITGSSATGGCTIHFPSNFDPSDPNHTFDASTLTGYPTFGGSASYIYLAYDLPATE